MPWITPTLKETRRLTRDYVLSQLGAKAMIPNSVLRIMSDAMSGLTHLTFLYLDWLSKQLLPDTAEKEWLDRHGVIWLVNADGSKGRKVATYASGVFQFAGFPDTIIPLGTVLSGASGVTYQTVTEGRIGGDGFGTADAAALTAGVIGNMPMGTAVNMLQPVFGVNEVTCYEDMEGGVDEETDEQLRERILKRIQNPPMGGSQADYESWTLAVPGVTRAWAATEMGVGTITIRFVMDDDRVFTPDDLPTESDIEAVTEYIDVMRPVTVKDCFIEAPLLHFYDVTIIGLAVDDPSMRARIEAAIKEMEFRKSKPGQTMYRSWVDEAISQAIGEQHHELIFETVTMPSPGYMPIVGTILYE